MPTSRHAPSPCSIRRATTADMPAVLAFIGETYGPGAPFKDAARLSWQFSGAPWRDDPSDDPALWIAHDGARVVGTIGVQDGAAWIGAERVPAGWIVDVMVHPDRRGQGLGHEIHAAVMRERTTLVTLTMAAATRRIAERAGAITLGPTAQFVCPARLGAATVARYLRYKSAGRGRLAPPLRAFAASGLGPAAVALAGRAAARLRLAARGPRGEALRGFEIEETGRFPEEIDGFWQEVRAELPAVFDRSAAALNWRFADCPGLSYRRFLLRRQGRLRGYLVTRLGVAEELPVGVVADLLVRPGDAAAADDLLALARETLLPRCDFLEAAASAPFLAAALRRAGFLATRRMHPTVVCSDPALRARIAGRRDAWYFTKGDHDWDQVHPV